MGELKESRIWIDGCFDFAHHGHAGAMMQARQHGDELFVGVHNDADILENKGPPVMTLDERMAAVEGCRWCTIAIPNAPYVTDPKVMDEYQCKYVVHGDDITTDKDGKDCYAEVKEKGSFIVVKRTPNISTTDLVGRMLLFSKEHHMPSVDSNQWGKWFKGETVGMDDKRVLLTPSNVERYEKYATAADAKSPGAYVWVWTNDDNKFYELVKGNLDSKSFYYVDGGFDLFNPGHITLLKDIHERASIEGAKVIVGIADDKTVNNIKGKNYPIMNIFERSLCVLQSKYIDGIVLGAPDIVSCEFIQSFPQDFKICRVLHGPTDVDEDKNYNYPQEMGIYEKITTNKYSKMGVSSIVERVLSNKAAFEERQRRKGWKCENEKLLELEEKKKKKMEE